MEDFNIKTDEEIVEIVRADNKELYALLVKRYQTKLMRYAEYLIGDHEKASDAVQQSLIKAYVNLNGFDTKKKFSSWIYRIVHNEAVNSIKKNKKEVPLIEAVDLSGGKGIEEDLEKKEIIKKAHKCLGQIPVIYSEPLILYYFDERSYEEISDILRIPMGTVAVRINRAKIYMKKICETKK